MTGLSIVLVQQLKMFVKTRGCRPSTVLSIFLLLLLGCGGGQNQPKPPGSPQNIAFVSTRAVDGSDASNVSCQILTNNGSQTEVGTNIWVINTDGSDARPLTKQTSCMMETDRTAWSPDGSRVAFASLRALDGSDALNTNSAQNVWVVNVDGTGTTALTRYTASLAFGREGVWSP